MHTCARRSLAGRPGWHTYRSETFVPEITSVCVCVLPLPSLDRNKCAGQCFRFYRYVCPFAPVARPPFLLANRTGSNKRLFQALFSTHQGESVQAKAPASPNVGRENDHVDFRQRYPLEFPQHVPSGSFVHPCQPSTSAILVSSLTVLSLCSSPRTPDMELV
jgi:hypothetical protein